MRIENAKHAGDFLMEIYGNILDRHNQPKELEITSIPELDDRLCGLNKKKLVVVGGRTSQGKSTLMLQMAMDFAFQGKTVLFFSLEMTYEVCVERMISSYCEINNRSMRNGSHHRDADNYASAMSELNDKLAKSKLIIIEDDGKNIDDVIQMLDVVKNVDVVFVDYIQHILVPKGRKRKEAMDEYLTSLRSHAKQNNYCAIVGSQINRGTHDGHKIRVPSLWELKETGTIEEIADQVLLCHWASFYQEELNDTYLINIAKNRDGETGYIYCRFQPEFCKIKEGYGKPEDKDRIRACFGHS